MPKKDNISLKTKDSIIYVPTVHGDERGYFMESFKEIEGIKFIQDNESLSEQVGTFRGMHLQIGEYSQNKLIRVLDGEIFDFIVDLRPESPTYLEHDVVKLDNIQKKSLLVPAGFAHGFLVTKPMTRVLYKVDKPYNKESDISIIWSDNKLGIKQEIEEKIEGEIILSEKDKNGISFEEYIERAKNEK